MTSHLGGNGPGDLKLTAVLFLWVPSHTSKSGISILEYPLLALVGSWDCKKLEDLVSPSQSEISLIFLSSLLHPCCSISITSSVWCSPFCVHSSWLPFGLPRPNLSAYWASLMKLLNMYAYLSDSFEFRKRTLLKPITLLYIGWVSLWKFNSVTYWLAGALRCICLLHRSTYVPSGWL